MAGVDPIYKSLIQFVPEKTSPKSSISKSLKQMSTCLTDAGKDIRHFYEDVVGTSSSCSSTQTIRKSTLKAKERTKNSNNEVDMRVKPKSVHSKITHSVSSDKRTYTPDTSVSSSAIPSPCVQTQSFAQSLSRDQRRHFKFLQAAEAGDVSELTDLFKQGVDINYKDFYGWTALMCAAKAGHRETVTHLLNEGADAGLVNNEGQTAVDLAKMAGKKDIAFEIEHYNPVSEEEENCISTTSDSLPSFFCSVCKGHFSQSETNSHLTSTVHLFNSGRKPQHPAYLLSETNRGFQMMLRSGWQVTKGLGPDGTGVKYPIKTILKRDRQGLGTGAESQSKAKITHFNPWDSSAVSSINIYPKRKISARKSAQYSLKSKERKMRRLEQGLRHDLSGL